MMMCGLLWPENFAVIDKKNYGFRHNPHFETSNSIKPIREN